MALNLAAASRKRTLVAGGAASRRDARLVAARRGREAKSRSRATTAWSAPRRRRAPRTGARPSRRAPAASPATPQSDAHTMHRSPAVVLGCTDCHGGNPTVRRRRIVADPRRPGLCRGARAGARAAALPDRLALSVLGQSEAHLHPAQLEAPEYRPLRQPVRLSRRARFLRRLPYRDHRGGRALADGDRRDAVGRRGLQ